MAVTPPYLTTFNPFGVLQLTAAIFFTLSAVYALFRHRGSRVYSYYALLAFMLALKHTAEAINTSNLDLSYQNWSVHYIFAFLYTSPLVILRLLQGLTFSKSRNTPLAFLALISTGFFTGHILYTDFFFNQSETFELVFLPPARIVFLYYLLAMAFNAMHLRKAFQKNTQEFLAGRRRYAMLALLLFTVYTSRTFVSPVYSVPSDLLGLLIVFYTGSHRYLWTLTELFKKTFFWFIASSIPIIPVCLLNYLIISDYFGLPLSFSIGAIIFQYYLLFFYFRQYQHQIDRYFRRIPREFRDHLDQYKSNLILMLSVSSLIIKLKEVIGQLFPVTHFNVLVWDEKYGAFVPFASKDPPARLMFRVYDEMFLWLGEQENVFKRDDLLFGDYPEPLKASARNFFSRTEAEIIIPMALNRSLLALMYMGSKLDGSRFTTGEFYFLTEIRNVTSIAFSNSYLYERITALNETLEEKVRSRTRDLEEAQSQLVHSEKLASLGVMVAGIAHEVNTPAGVINGAISNISENLNDFLDAALHDAPERFEALVMRVVTRKNIARLDASERYQKTKKLQKELRDKFMLEENESDQRADFLVSFEDKELVKQVAALTDAEFKLLQKVSHLSQNVQNIRIAIEAIVRIVRALKYYSHINQSETEEVYLREGIENTLIILHNQLKHGIRVNRHFDEVAAITCVVGEMNQIWTNLVTNAIQAMKGKGTLNIYLSQVYLVSRPRVAILSPEDLAVLISENKTDYEYQQVIIEDDGPGISKVNLDKVFDPFFTTKGPGEGTGLGLGIVKNIVANHEGAMSVASQKGKTRFTILLPQKSGRQVS